jgi:hypothetical protein
VGKYVQITEVPKYHGRIHPMPGELSAEKIFSYTALGLAYSALADTMLFGKFRILGRGF